MQRVAGAVDLWRDTPFHDNLSACHWRSCPAVSRYISNVQSAESSAGQTPTCHRLAYDEAELRDVDRLVVYSYLMSIADRLLPCLILVYCARRILFARPSLATATIRTLCYMVMATQQRQQQQRSVGVLLIIVMIDIPARHGHIWCENAFQPSWYHACGAGRGSSNGPNHSVHSAEYTVATKNSPRRQSMLPKSKPTVARSESMLPKAKRTV